MKSGTNIPLHPEVGKLLSHRQQWGLPNVCLCADFNLRGKNGLDLLEDSKDMKYHEELYRYWLIRKHKNIHGKQQAACFK